MLKGSKQANMVGDLQIFSPVGLAITWIQPHQISSNMIVEEIENDYKLMQFWGV